MPFVFVFFVCFFYRFSLLYIYIYTVFFKETTYFHPKFISSNLQVVFCLKKKLFKVFSVLLLSPFRFCSSITSFDALLSPLPPCINSHKINVASMKQHESSRSEPPGLTFALNTQMQLEVRNVGHLS